MYNDEMTNRTALLPVDVRPLARDNLLLLEQYLPYGPPEKHADRLARQERGEVIYLIAWREDIPLGHALLNWRGATEDHLVATFKGTCPDIEDLLVAEQYRSQGIGAQILLAAERLVKERGYSQIGLSVDVHNTRAYALYERLGYHNIGLPPHHERGEYMDAQGHIAVWEETCIYMVKSL